MLRFQDYGDSWGHMAVQGVTGFHLYRDHLRQWHAVHFGFKFDLEQLARAVTTEWVQKAARDV